MPKFIPGLKLAEGYYRDVVAPLLAQNFPSLAHSAALIGAGSEVLGLDTEMSTDHGWGPRCQIFVGEKNSEHMSREISDCLAAQLPRGYRGYSTSFYNPDPLRKTVTHMVPKASGPVDHYIQVTTLKQFSEMNLGIDATRPIADEVWLALPQQFLLTLVSGKIFHDEVGLGEMRETLAWYPQDVWLYIMGCTWWRLRRYEQMVGRVGLLEDELGASLLGARIVQDLMRLAFLMERKYIPYPKWQGAMFGKLNCASKLNPMFAQILSAKGWLERDAALATAFETIAKMHNGLGVTKPLPEKCQQFMGRGYHFINSGDFARTLFGQVNSPQLSKMFKQSLPGNIDLVTDSIDMHHSTLDGGRILRLFQPD